MKNLSLLFIAFLLCFVFLVSCGGDDNPTQPSNPTLTGAWVGTGSGFVINATLSQTGTSVSGNGTMAASGISLACTFSGTNVYPNISLTISVLGFQDSNYTGTFSNDNTHSGKLNGSGFVDVNLTFVRQ